MQEPSLWNLSYLLAVSATFVEWGHIQVSACRVSALLLLAVDRDPPGEVNLMNVLLLVTSLITSPTKESIGWFSILWSQVCNNGCDTRLIWLICSTASCREVSEMLRTEDLFRNRAAKWCSHWLFSSFASLPSTNLRHYGGGDIILCLNIWTRGRSFTQIPRENFRCEWHFSVHWMLFGFRCIKCGVIVGLKFSPGYGQVTFGFSFKCPRKWLEKVETVPDSTKSHSWQWNTVSLLWPGFFWVCQVDKCTLRALKDMNVHMHSLCGQGGCAIYEWDPCLKR